ncbi:MAG: proline/glycine betaine ABC transporter permease [Chloroflexota bacterium]|nr:proline/glycine betaine ABC transporter permease [Chloroflexota bacterium]MDE2893359.1 proline/glycine betaine ABC transporter permease [Chloroflexota bacterium]
MTTRPLPRSASRQLLTEIMSGRIQLPASAWWMAPLAILVVGLLFVLAYFLVADEFPFDVGRDVGHRIDVWLDWLEDNLSPLFQAIKDVIVWFLISLEDMMLWLTWPAMIGAIALTSWLLVSFRMALFSACSLLLLATFGLWESTVETLALIIVTVTLSIMIAVPMGVWASQSDRLDAILRPILDGMQTMPSFVYLVPAIAFFSLGNTPAVLATLIYAVPPAVRLTNLGIRQLPAETLEAADSFGMTRSQMLLKVKIPLAIPTIMAGVNQTTLMALSMVVIASLVGAGGLGLDVNRALGRIEPGNGFLAGLGIVFVAIIIDRVTQALTKRQQTALGSD